MTTLRASICMLLFAVSIMRCTCTPFATQSTCKVSLCVVIVTRATRAFCGFLFSIILNESELCSWDARLPILERLPIFLLARTSCMYKFKRLLAAR
eukprot:jgi/Mesvir1/7523/Mv25825-RA.1